MSKTAGGLDILGSCGKDSIDLILNPLNSCNLSYEKFDIGSDHMIVDNNGQTEFMGISILSSTKINTKKSLINKISDKISISW
jgi:hypothetical protein